MRRFVALTVCLWAALAVVAQTQQGFVKTKGRMVNGQHVAGQGLPGATVTIQGRSAVAVKNANGSFSFPVSGKSFRVQGVQKKGYQLVDADATAKAYHYSPNPIFFVMEMPEQQMEDLLIAQEKISQGLKKQYQRSLAENRRLREENRISQEEYEKNLQQIINEQNNSGKLIKEMAERYASMDYDQLDEFGQRISELILNGDLQEADSMLKTKGDISSRADIFRREWQVLNDEKENLAQQRQKTVQARELLQKKMEELATDCYSKAEIFKMQFMVDSAMHYLRQRAELDTMRSDWTYNFAYYCYENNYYSQAISGCERILALYPQEPLLETKTLLGIVYHLTGQRGKSTALFEDLVEQRQLIYASNPGTADQLATSLMNLGNTYKETGRYDDAERVYSESLKLKRQLAHDTEGEFDVATTLYNLATLYLNQSRFAEAEPYLQEAQTIYRRCIDRDPSNLEYQEDLAHLLRMIGAMYHETQRQKEGIQLAEESVDICQELAERNPQKYNLSLSSSLSTVAAIYKDTYRMDDYEATLLRILDIKRGYAKEDPTMFGAGLVVTLDTLANLYRLTDRVGQRIDVVREKVEMCRYLSIANPQKYLPMVAWDLRVLAMNEIDDRPKEGMAHCLESVERYRELSKDNPAFEPFLADVLGMLGDYYSQDSLVADAEQAYLESIEIMKRQPAENQEYLSVPMAIGLYNLGLLYYRKADWEKAQDAFFQSRDIYKKLSDIDPQKFEEDYQGACGMIKKIKEKMEK
ncbi:MAG: tetratricopeptide repeat protein [Prevotella sp.]|nr:tetratricopeptide repeat protein [Prevotella sp.]